MFGMSSSLLVKSVVWGYHVYQVLRKPKIREKVIVLREQGSKHGRQAMAVYHEKEPGVILSDIYHKR